MLGGLVPPARLPSVGDCVSSSSLRAANTEEEEEEGDFHETREK